MSLWQLVYRTSILNFYSKSGYSQLSMAFIMGLRWPAGWPLVFHLKWLGISKTIEFSSLKGLIFM